MSVQSIVSLASFLCMGAIVAGTGCTWVPLEKGADHVRVIHPDTAASCKQVAKTRATTARSILLIPRGRETMSEELQAIARNEALKSGGDAVSALGPIEDGVQEFGIYRCAQDAETESSS